MPVTPDQTIADAVSRALFRDPLTRTMAVRVHVFGSEVFLVGAPRQGPERERLLAVTAEVPGPKKVRPVSAAAESGAEPGSCTSKDNLSLAYRAQQAIFDAPELDWTLMAADAAGCEVVLMGFVREPEQMAMAEELAANLPGARGVRSFLQLAPAGNS